MAPSFTFFTVVLFLTHFVVGSEYQCNVGEVVRKIFKGTKVCVDAEELVALASLQNATRFSEEKVFFSAYIPSHISASSMTRNQPVKYTDVVTNVGNVYNPQTGEFTAPRSGGYVFFWEFLVFPGGYICLELQINGKLFAHNYGHGADSMYEVASKSTIVNLRKGDKVRVVFHDGNGKLHGAGNRYTSLSGYSLN